MVRQIADEILIMYLGHIVERAKSKDIYSDARHPYTKVLLKAAPSIKKGINDEGFSLDLKVGDTPSPENPPKGCPFCTRWTMSAWKNAPKTWRFLPDILLCAASSADNIHCTVQRRSYEL